MLSRSCLSLSILSTVALLSPGCFHGVDDPDADFGVAEDDEAPVEPPLAEPAPTCSPGQV